MTVRGIGRFCQAEWVAREQLLDLEQTVFNCVVAAQDHRDQIPLSPCPVDRFSFLCPMDAQWGVAEAQGERQEMEDRHLAFETWRYRIWGVLDGHGGKGAVEKALALIPSLLPGFIETKITLTLALQALCAHLGHLQREEKSGTTLVLSLLDKRTGQLHTATLGDSEAFVWRQDTGAVEPLSLVRSFDRSPDQQRVKAVYQRVGAEYVLAWENGITVARGRGDKPRVVSLQQCGRLQADRQAETLRYFLHNALCGLTTPRALGDSDYPEVISTEPDDTLTVVRSGDVLLMGSDGVTDLMQRLCPRVQEVLSRQGPMQEVAHTVVQKALACERPGGADNITLIAIRFQSSEGM
jgi:serine/threonine protein phosphatase PrpC